MTEKYVTIPENELAALVHDRTELATMLSNLIVMWKHEEKLKQHHRPYLHVRKEMGNFCDTYLQQLSEMKRDMENGLHIRPTEYASEISPKDSVPKDQAYKAVDVLVNDILSLMEYLRIYDYMVDMILTGIDLKEIKEQVDLFVCERKSEIIDRCEKHWKEFTDDLED